MIFKVQGPKCFFCKTYSLPLIFGVFFISVPLFSILIFYKKSKSICLPLELNHTQKKKFENQIEKIQNFTRIIHNNIKDEKLTPFKIIHNIIKYIICP